MALVIGNLNKILTVWGIDIKTIVIFRPNLSESQPNRNTERDPNIIIDPAHADSSRVNLFFNGVWSDCSSGKFGPIHPMTTPKINAVLWAVQNN